MEQNVKKANAEVEKLRVDDTHGRVGVLVGQYMAGRGPRMVSL